MANMAKTPDGLHVLDRLYLLRLMLSSMEIKSSRCYIDEYTNSFGAPSARLREKITGRKVDLGISGIADRQQFLAFLSAAKRSQDAMPDVFNKDGSADAIVVSGQIDFDAPDEIRYLHNDSLSYFVE